MFMLAYYVKMFVQNVRHFYQAQTISPEMLKKASQPMWSFPYMLGKMFSENVCPTCLPNMFAERVCREIALL